MNNSVMFYLTRCWLLLCQQSIAKAAKKGIHSEAEYKKKTVNDLSDPKKAKTYASTLERAGMTKAIVDYCFNGSRFKLFVPSENCYIVFALSNIRCPQPSPNQGALSRGQGELLASSSLFVNMMCLTLPLFLHHSQSSRAIW